METKRRKRKNRKPLKVCGKVSFLKDRSKSVEVSIKQLRLFLNNPSSSVSSKKQAKKTLSKALWFDQERYKYYLIKLQKFTLLTLKVDISDSLSWVVRQYEEAALKNGPVPAVKLFKQLHDIYIRMITSHSFQTPAFLKTNSRGEPSLLGPLLRLSRGTLEERRAGLHAIQVIKLVSVQDSDYSLKTITQDPPIEMLPLDQPCIPGNYLKRIADSPVANKTWLDLNLFRDCWIQTLEEEFPKVKRKSRLDDIRRRSKLHISGRNGPNGPCLTTVVLDQSSLAPLRTGDSELMSSIKEMAQMTRNMSLLNFILLFEEEPFTWSNDKGELPIDSRLSLKNEAWAKTRVFAICDWFSQSSLAGFHAHLFGWLEGQVEDGTFDQDRTSEMVRSWTADPALEPESADLSAATDSIPVEVQAEIVSQISGPGFSVLWRKICCDRNFKVPDSTEFIRYKTGQPMGILSSWAMLATWHHITMRTCLRYLGIQRSVSSARYVVVGDDVSMNGTNVFAVYSEFVSVIQGVGISKSKGFHLDTLTLQNPIPNISNPSSPVVAEFAKRIFYNNQEITVVPPDELLSAFEDATQFPELIDSISRRGYNLDLDEAVLPGLTRLCRQRRLALLLVTNPVRRCPRRVTPVLTDSSPYRSIPWYKPGFDEEAFERLFIKTIRGTLVATLLRVLTNVNNWIRWSIREEEVKVKAWHYESLTQRLLVRMIAQRIGGEVADLSDEAEEVFKRGNLNWISCKKFLGKLQKIFEVDYLFKEKTISKTRDRKQFSSTLLAKVIKSIDSGLRKL